MSQPSVEPAANSVTMPSAYGSPSRVVSKEPSRVATWGLLARASSRFSSMSGLMPGVTRRKTLKIATSENTTLVLLCSAPITRPSTSSGNSAPGSLTKRSGPTVADRSIRESRNCAAAGSYSAS